MNLSMLHQYTQKVKLETISFLTTSDYVCAQRLAALTNGLLAAFSRKLPDPVLDIENSKTLLLFWPKSDLQTLLTGTPEGSILWEHM